MNSLDGLLQQTLRIARASRDFFVFAEPAMKDSEVRMAFEYIGQVKGKLASDLEPYVAANDGQAVGATLSPASSVEKIYQDLRTSVRSSGVSAAAARTLAAGEEQLVRLVERAFEQATNATLKDMLKAYYPQLVICREAMARLRARQAA